MIVMAGTGKVVYWETISSAATFAFINKDRAGIEGAVGGMSAGEKVVAITSAEPAGFILTFNSGRLAFLTVRDAYGRPAISVQFLRAGVSTSSSGLFGSIRHAFSHLSLRGDIAAVRADRSSRVGERNVVSMTKKARLQAWRLHRSGHHEALAEVEARDTIVSAIQEFDDVSRDFPAESFEALDLTFTPHGLEDKYLDLSRLSTVMSNDDPLVQHLVLLVSFTKRTTSRYVLVEAVLSSDGCRVGMIRPLTSYSSPLIPTSDSQVCKPRIYLPRPALVAFAVFDRAAVVASVAATPESPDTQLQSDSHILPASYEDVVDFGEDNHDILGSGIEELTSHTHNHEDSRVQRQRSKNPAALLLVRGAGLVRVLTTDIDKLASDKPPRVSARSKLEQAVFFGAKSDNPLNFDTKSDIHFPKEEISAAALEVSQEILSSSSTYLPTVSPSTEDNLRMRSAALERLINHLRAIDADIDRATRWNLLFDAEKMHVATLLWRRHESFLAAGAANDQPSIFKAIIDSINEDEKSNPQIQKGEVDPIRHWFINDVHRLHFLVAWAYQTIKTRYKEKLLGDTDLTVQMWEAMQINTCAHNGAIDFRTQNLGTYGLAAEKLQSGIPVDGFEGLDQPWTGNYYIANNVTRLVDLTSQWVLVDHWSGKPSGSALPDRKIIGKIADDLPVLMEVMLCAILEFAKWARSTPDAENRTMGQTFADTYESSKHTLPLKLIELEKWEEAAKLARKHDSLAALAEILIRHVQELENALEAGDLTLVQAQALKNTRLAKKTQIEDCFAKYGEDFAFPAYDFLLTNHGVDEMLQFELDKFGLKTKFLRSRPELARISWIHDVQEEQDVDHAADTLLDLAFSKEQQVWNKKIELSLGKLALLAQQGDKPNGNKDFRINADEARQEQKLSKVNKELVAIKIQDELYNVVSPTTYNAIDETAALDIALDVHAKSIPKRQKALQMNFEDGMKRLLKHEALDAMTLIDLLTLIELDEDARTQIFNPFWMALKVADSVCQADEVKDAKRLIWRRAFLRDDWTKLNDTKNKNDRAVVEALAGTELFDLLVSCIQRRKWSPMTHSLTENRTRTDIRLIDRRQKGTIPPNAATGRARRVRGRAGSSLPRLQRRRLQDQAAGRDEVGGQDAPEPHRQTPAGKVGAGHF